MKLSSSKALLGGLSPTEFMLRHWQRKPLLVRQAWPQLKLPVTRPELFALAARDDVQSRLVWRDGEQWGVRHGPFRRRSLLPVARAGWTLLVQGVDHQVHAAHEMLSAFDFVPAARLDDVMVSWASDEGGVGPHVDSYDVFLLQWQGTRRWRISRPRHHQLVPDIPLKILSCFEPEQEWMLEPGDMLYLPPGWAHEGTAIGECMTCSIGFRAPRSQGIAHEVLLRLADSIGESDQAHGDMSPLYTDAGQAAVKRPGAIPRALQRFSRQSVQSALRRSSDWNRALGEVLSEPKAHVWFASDEARPDDRRSMWQLALGTRMLYDAKHVYINGESFLATGADAVALRRLADARRISAAQRRALTAGARRIVLEWLRLGWLTRVDVMGNQV